VELNEAVLGCPICTFSISFGCSLFSKERWWWLFRPVFGCLVVLRK